MPNNKQAIKVLYRCGHSKMIECTPGEVLRERNRYQGFDCWKCRAAEALESAAELEFPPLKGDTEMEELRAAVYRSKIMKTLLNDVRRSFDQRTEAMTDEQRERFRTVLKTHLRHMGQREKASDWIRDSRTDSKDRLEKAFSSADAGLYFSSRESTADLQAKYERLRNPP